MYSVKKKEVLFGSFAPVLSLRFGIRLLRRSHCPFLALIILSHLNLSISVLHCISLLSDSSSQRPALLSASLFPNL